MKITSRQLRQIIHEELNEAKKLKLIVTNEKTGEVIDVAVFNSPGDLNIALNALQKAAPPHMQYSIKK